VFFSKTTTTEQDETSVSSEVRDHSVYWKSGGEALEDPTETGVLSQNTMSIIDDVRYIVASPSKGLIRVYIVDEFFNEISHVETIIGSGIIVTDGSLYKDGDYLYLVCSAQNTVGNTTSPYLYMAKMNLDLTGLTLLNISTYSFGGSYSYSSSQADISMIIDHFLYTIVLNRDASSYFRAYIVKYDLVNNTFTSLNTFTPTRTWDSILYLKLSYTNGLFQFFMSKNYDGTLTSRPVYRMEFNSNLSVTNALTNVISITQRGGIVVTTDSNYYIMYNLSSGYPDYIMYTKIDKFNYSNTFINNYTFTALNSYWDASFLQINSDLVLSVCDGEYDTPQYTKTYLWDDSLNLISEKTIVDWTSFKPIVNWAGGGRTYIYDEYLYISSEVSWDDGETTYFNKIPFSYLYATSWARIIRINI
jgi:hypothetical protein